MAPSSPNKLVICRLEDNLRIAACGDSYVLQERIYDENNKDKYRWKDKNYSSWIGGVLRAYVLYSLQRFAHTDISGNVKHLIDQIEQLNLTIRETDTTLTQLQKDYDSDPIELAILAEHTNDAIERHLSGD